MIESCFSESAVLSYKSLSVSILLTASSILFKRNFIQIKFKIVSLKIGKAILVVVRDYNQIAPYLGTKSVNQEVSDILGKISDSKFQLLVSNFTRILVCSSTIRYFKM